MAELDLTPGTARRIDGRSAAKYYADSGAWHPEAERAESLEQVCQKYLYDSAHAQHVSQLALNAFYQLHDLHQLPEKYASILNAAAMLPSEPEALVV